MLLNKTVLKLRTHSHFCLDYWINNTFYKQYRVFSHTSFVLSIKGNKRWYLKLVVSAEMNSKWTLKKLSYGNFLKNESFRILFNFMHPMKSNEMFKNQNVY